MTSYLPPNSKAETFKNFCIEYINNFNKYLAKGTSIILCGTTGTGKTHLACAVANEVINQHSRVAHFTTAMKFFRDVKQTYHPSSKRETQDVIKHYAFQDLLIVDEVGVQFGTDTERTILFELMNERYLKLKPTILISNLSLENLTDYVGERVIDRMRENGGKLLVCDWESYRIKS